jgi:tRNA(adenine34) deaminase
VGEGRLRPPLLFQAYHRRVPERDDELMAEALAEAEQSLAVDEFPVGAVVVARDEVVARAHWTGFAQRRLLDHAEMLALMDAERSGRVASRRERRQATLYTTLEPCPLCMAAGMSFLLGRIVFAAAAPVDGGVNLPEVWAPPNGHPQDGMPYSIPLVTGGVQCDESIKLIAEWMRRDPERRSWAQPYVAAI